MRWIHALLSALVLLPTSAFAATYWIAPDGSGDHPAIQAALAAAQDGDVIELAAGLFTGEGNRDLDFLGKAVTVRSVLGDPGSCILDCAGSEADLVDEIRTFTFPVLLGKGKRLFDKSSRPRAFKLTHSAVSPNGPHFTIVTLHDVVWPPADSRKTYDPAATPAASQRRWWSPAV